MKTIKEGNRNEPPKRWWHGLKSTCQHCGEVVELEPLDGQMGRITEVNERHPQGGQSVVYGCSCCGGNVTLKKVK